MKEYIIDLGLEFGLRIRLAVAETIQPGPKINEENGRGIFVIAREPPFSLTCPRPPRFSLSSLSLLFYFLLLLSSAINAMLKLQISPQTTSNFTKSNSPTS